MKLFRIANLVIVAAMACGANAQSLGDIFKKSGSSIGQKIGSAVDNLMSSDKFEVEALQGNWKYASPAVAFKSDNALQSIGGAAASTEIENKLVPYYEKAGVTKATLEVDTANNFVLKLNKITLKGTITKDETTKTLAFNFKAFGKVKLGKVDCIATKTGDKLNLCFDAKRFVNILSTVANLSKQKTLTSLTDLLRSYDGIYIGMRVIKG